MTKSKKSKKIIDLSGAVNETSEKFEIKNYDYGIEENNEDLQFEQDLDFLLNDQLEIEDTDLSSQIQVIDEYSYENTLVSTSKSKKRKPKNIKINIDAITEDINDIVFSSYEEDSDTESQQKLKEKINLVSNSLKKKSLSKKNTKSIHNKNLSTHESAEGSQEKNKKKKSKSKSNKNEKEVASDVTKVELITEPEVDSESKEKKKSKKKTKSKPKLKSETKGNEESISKKIEAVSKSNEPNQIRHKEKELKKTKSRSKIEEKEITSISPKLTSTEDSEPSKSKKKKKTKAKPEAKTITENESKSDANGKTGTKPEEQQPETSSKYEINSAMESVEAPKVKSKSKKNLKKKAKSNLQETSSTIESESNLDFKKEESKKGKNDETINKSKEKKIVKKTKKKDQKKHKKGINLGSDEELNGVEPNDKIKDIRTNIIDDEINEDSDSKSETQSISEDLEEPNGTFKVLGDLSNLENLSNSSESFSIKTKSPELEIFRDVSNDSVDQKLPDSQNEFLGIKLKPVKHSTSAKLKDSLQSSPSVKTIIGLSKEQILKISLSDVKIKTIVSSSKSKYTHLLLNFALKHSHDLFENLMEKKQFFSLCIDVALYESQGFKKNTDSNPEVFKVIDRYDEFKLEKTRTKYTPSSKNAHKNDYDYTTLSFIGHVLLWAVNQNDSNGNPLFCNLSDLNLTSTTVLKCIGGYYLWDKLKRHKTINSKRWKHIIKFRQHFPLEEDQFVLIVRMMNLGTNNGAA